MTLLRLLGLFIFVLIKESYASNLTKISCPSDSGVSMHVSSVVSRLQEGNNTLYLVQAHQQDVTVSCQSLDNQDISLILTPELESEKETTSTNNSVVAWQANYTNIWSSKNASCSLKDQDKPSCQVQIKLFVDHKSNCTANETLTCNISELINELVDKKKSARNCYKKRPTIDFHVYQSSNESWIKCEGKKEPGLRYQEPNCPIQYKENETVVLKLSLEWSTGRFRKETCEEHIYTTISGSNVVIIYNDDTYHATYTIIGVVATLVIIIILFCYLMSWKRKVIKIGRTSRSQTFIRDKNSSCISLHSCTGSPANEDYLPVHTRSSSGGAGTGQYLSVMGSTSCKTSEISDNSGQSDYRRLLCKSSSVTLNDDMNVNSQVRALDYDNEKFDIPRTSFKLQYIIGEGEYGTVYKARAKGIRGSNDTITVAAKEVKNILDRNQWLTIVDELKILSYLDTHYCLVNLVAAYTENIDNHELFLLLEYCPYGNLKKFLIDKQDKFIGSLSNKPGYLETEFNWNLLLTWSYSVASGMDYLVSKNIMHGDLAARNVLIGENYSAKISDFGLSKMMYYNEDYRKTERRLIPLAWMAIEYLRTGEFNMMSDVWSFGVTLWEIFSLGNKPYGLIQYETLKKNILAGERLESPEPLDLHPDGAEFFKKVIAPCWREDFKTRPTFSESMQNISVFLGAEGIESHKRGEREYLKKHSSVVSIPEQLKQLPDQQKQPLQEPPVKKAAPTGYVRMESMEKPVQQHNASQENTSPSNFDKPYTSIQLSNFGGPYSKMTGSGETGREVKAEPSSTHPGYIEMAAITTKSPLYSTSESIHNMSEKQQEQSQQVPVTSGLAGKSADLSSTNLTADNNGSTKLSKLPDENYSNKSSRTNRLSDSGYTVATKDSQGLTRLEIPSNPVISISSPTP